MANGEVHAWNILDRQPVLAKWDNGIFTDITPTTNRLRKTGGSVLHSLTCKSTALPESIFSRMT